MPARPYRLIDAALVARTPLSPHMARLTFGGPDVARVKTGSPDQRIKIFFPGASGDRIVPDANGEWHALYKAADPARRPAMRTYTIRAMRPQMAEMDVDFVLHGETGPASRWALNARLGDAVQITAPNADWCGDPAGYEWRPPADVSDVLLIADETAVPAAAGIIEQLQTWPRRPRVQAFLEVPEPEDALPLPRWPGLELTWLPRGCGVHGARMIAAAREALVPAGRALALAEADTALPQVDIETQILWDRAASATAGFYAWVAGESAAVMAIRRHLIQDRGLDRSCVNLMGYWRLGRVLE